MLSLLNATQQRTALLAACRSVAAPMRWFADGAEQDPLADWRIAARQQTIEAQKGREDKRGAPALANSCMVPHNKPVMHHLVLPDRLLRNKCNTDAEVCSRVHTGSRLFHQVSGRWMCKRLWQAGFCTLAALQMSELVCIYAGGANVQQESAQPSAPPPQRPALSTRLLFDKDTAVSLPTPEEQATAVEKREERVQAAGERAGKASSSARRTQEHTFLQPQALADLPAELRPHFKLAIRCAALNAGDAPFVTERWCLPGCCWTKQ